MATKKSAYKTGGMKNSNSSAKVTPTAKKGGAVKKMGKKK